MNNPHEANARLAHPAMRLGVLLIGNVALACGPWLVRLSDTGPVAAGFWRLTLALPLIVIFALREPRGGAAGRVGPAVLALVVLAGVLFALDIAAWHLGIARTRMGNAALFGNSGSVILMGWALVAARRIPGWREMAAVGAALAGASLLMGESLMISPTNLVGDLLSLLAGMFYAAYLLMLRSVRSKLGPWSLLVVVILAGSPLLLLMALALGEAVMPQSWWPVLTLAIASQVIGQGLLVRALGWFGPLVIGVALLSQPAIAAAIGWFAFAEGLSMLDIFGMALMGAALLLARLAEARRARA